MFWLNKRDNAISFKVNPDVGGSPANDARRRKVITMVNGLVEEKAPILDAFKVPLANITGAIIVI